MSVFFASPGGKDEARPSSRTRREPRAHLLPLSLSAPRTELGLGPQIPTRNRPLAPTPKRALAAGTWPPSLMTPALGDRATNTCRQGVVPGTKVPSPSHQDTRVSQGKADARPQAPAAAPGVLAGDQGVLRRASTPLAGQRVQGDRSCCLPAVVRGSPHWCWPTSHPGWQAGREGTVPACKGHHPGQGAGGPTTAGTVSAGLSIKGQRQGGRGWRIPC